jgi:peptide subunit release factor 1 (eRF1)
MKLLDRGQLETLAKFHSKDYLTTSFFLDTSKNRMSKKEIQVSFKNLLNSGRIKIEQMSLPKSKKDSLFQDLERINDFCSRGLSAYPYVGWALFSCQSMDFWQEFNLVKSPRNMIIFDRNPYVRPLSAILDEYHRTCLLTFNGREAKWFEIFMGEINPLETLTGDVPGKVREGGWEGYASKRIERHRAARLHEFIKQIAAVTFNLMEKADYDWLFLGCHDEHCQELEPLLHPYIRKKLVYRLKVNPADSENKILQQALKAKDLLKKREKDELVQRFLTEVERDGLAVSGLDQTLEKINHGEVQTLLVTRHFSQAGRQCPKCHVLSRADAVCPACRIKTTPLPDVIDEAVEAAFNSRSSVKHINPPTPLEGLGGIGAFLRYKT